MEMKMDEKLLKEIAQFGMIKLMFRFCFHCVSFRVVSMED